MDGKSQFAVQSADSADDVTKFNANDAELLLEVSSAIKTDRLLRVVSNVSMFSNEFALILQIAKRSKIIVKEAALSSSLSNRGFYEMINRMKSNGIIEVVPHESDRRSKYLSLHPSFAKVLEGSGVKFAGGLHA